MWWWHRELWYCDHYQYCTSTGRERCPTSLLFTVNERFVYCKQVLLFTVNTTPTEATVRTYVRHAVRNFCGCSSTVQYCSHKMATASTTTPLNTHHRDRATFTLLHLNNQTTPDSHSTSGKHLNTYSTIACWSHCWIPVVSVLTAILLLLLLSTR